jgi:ribosomal peptide maturation radical SAM protein 1
MRGLTGPNPAACSATAGDVRLGKNVALVYPPFGPSGVASLGIGLLSASLKARGIECRTFHWNLDVIAELPGPDLSTRLFLYRQLTQRNTMPFNEWAFADLVHGDALRHRVKDVHRELRETMDVVYASAEIRRQVSGAILSLRERAAECVDRMAARLEPYDIIGINSTFFQNLPALALAKRIKAQYPHKIVVMGGANCDGEMGPALAEKFPFLDAVFIGEADLAFPDYIARVSRGAPVNDVPGIVYHDSDGSIKFGPPGGPLSDLDSLPVPDFDDFVAARHDLGIDELQELTLPLESSRGCWWGARHHCTFCGLNANGMGYRQKSAKRFQSEVEQIADRYGVQYVFMADNILSMDYYREFMDWSAASPRPIRFFYEIKANANRHHVERLASAKISGVQPGIESFSSSVLSLMQKGTTGIQNVAFLKYAREYGIFVAYNILVDFPGEDPVAYEQLAVEMRKLFHLRPPSSVPEVEYHRFSPYHREPDRFGIKLQPSPKYQHLYPFTVQDIARIAYLFERIDRPPETRRYLLPMAEQIGLWHNSYNDNDCTLTWEQSGMDILIDDRRPSFTARRYRLRHHAAELFRSVDRPKSRRLLVDEAKEASGHENASTALAAIFAPAVNDEESRIEFTPSEFSADPARCMQQLVEGGLLFVEGDNYLALPVQRNYRATDMGWLQTGV